jgi:hypothetical protein
MGGIKVDAWSRDLAKTIFPKNGFAVKSISDNEFVNNDIVYLPQSGGTPVVVIDRTVFPGTTTQRVDSVIFYQLNEHSTNPTHIQYSEAAVLSYNKSQNVIGDHILKIADSIHVRLPIQWASTTASTQVTTTGALRNATAPGATGQRKMFTKADVLAAKRILDNQDIPAEGRCLLLSTEMYNDLLMDLSVMSRDYADTRPMVDGVVNQLFGFNIYTRSSVGRYATGSLIPKVPEALNAGTDNSFAIAWHPDFVRRALGETIVLVNIKRTEYYGDTVSALARAGGSKARQDGKGVVCIIEG